ncbi:hypothetical protein KDD17_02475 [Sulfitobacter albidus]|uniref:Transferrin-binding protein-like solute binding protein n=1 Tax=Sulfitobacter albidus TaxID=2829501 RepID=A0A975PN56_9RHOB|nr:hypothetical protein [Sulfitobacter albidus]QUJ76940.1 hypothetical protein KDD17_02475 [Sulfitobacter albidus]
MTKSIFLRGSATVLLCVSLSACLGNGNNGTAGGGTAGGGTGSGGSGGTPSQSDFDANIARVEGIAPSSTKQSGTFDYAGQVRLSTRDANANVNGELLGDVAATVNYDAETATGNVTNIAGTVDGAAVAFDGTLDTSTGAGSGTVVAATTNAPIVGSVTSTVVGLTVEGTLTESGGTDTAQVVLGLNGPTLGTNAEAIRGGAVAASTTFNGQQGINGIGAGDFYLDKQ